MDGWGRGLLRLAEGDSGGERNSQTGCGKDVHHEKNGNGNHER
jgi:hypothetical protein